MTYEPVGMISTCATTVAGRSWAAVPNWANVGLQLVMMMDKAIIKDKSTLAGFAALRKQISCSIFIVFTSPRYTQGNRKSTFLSLSVDGLLCFALPFTNCQSAI